METKLPNEQKALSDSFWKYTGIFKSFWGDHNRCC